MEVIVVALSYEEDFKFSKYSGYWRFIIEFLNRVIISWENVLLHVFTLEMITIYLATMLVFLCLKKIWGYIWVPCVWKKTGRAPMFLKCYISDIWPIILNSKTSTVFQNQQCFGEKIHSTSRISLL